MFEFLADLGREIVSRYHTVLRDIKSKSNSFYDAYLDLLEASVKAIVDTHGIERDESRTCGYLLRGEEVQNLFLNTLMVPKETYERIQSHLAKVNHHKHQKEKHLLLDSIVAFMETYHRFMAACCESQETFDGEYFRSIFGEYERVNLALEREKASIVEELDDLVKEKRMTEEQLAEYRKALSLSKSSEAEIAERNEALLREISALKSLKLSILDKKLSRTISMLNDLQEYVTESRAISLAVGYMIVGKENVDPYVELARKEMQRRKFPLPQSSCSSILETSEDEPDPENFFDIMDATAQKLKAEK